MDNRNIAMDRRTKTKFSIRDFFSLVNKLHPHYSRLIIGVLLGLLGTGANLFVPQLAQRLINNFKSLKPQRARQSRTVRILPAIPDTRRSRAVAS